MTIDKVIKIFISSVIFIFIGLIIEEPLLSYHIKDAENIALSICLLGIVYSIIHIK